MAATWYIPDLIKMAPEFAKVPAPIIQFYIDMAERRISTDYMGAVATDAGIYLTAHLMTLVPPSGYDASSAGAPGPITQQSVGDVSVSYGGVASMSLDSAAKKTSLGLTRYGLMFFELIRSRGPAAQVL